MINMTTKSALMLFLGSFFCLTFFASLTVSAATDEEVAKVTIEEKAVAAEKLEDKRELEDRLKREAAEIEDVNSVDAFDIDQIGLPEDTTQLLTVNQVSISGNTLISTEKLLKKIPAIYNNYSGPVENTVSDNLYDFSTLKEVFEIPGASRQISTRTIQGFTQYLLSVYQKSNYAGINVRVQQDAIQDGKLVDNNLAITVVEIPVSTVSITSYDVAREEREKNILRKDVIKEWSPAKPGQVVNEKELDDFMNLLNLNPDRYISANISKGTEPGSLAVGYNLYEIDPWHYFLQIDNAGTDDIKWSPRFGVINTNLTGRDDKFTGTAQVAPGNRPLENVDDMRNNYSAYGSYDFPIFTPRLRLNLFAGRSEYEIDGGEGIDFLGHGSHYGGELRLNVLQHEGWFFDVTSSLIQEKSKVTSSLFPEFFGSRLTMNLWGIGAEAHRSDDISYTSLGVKRIQSLSGGSGQDDYWNPSTGTGARTNADQDFEITTFSANHSQFLNPDKVHRFLGSFRYISPNTRVAPAKMTTFGGMYTVRGYKESRIVADGGLLASLQYEYDLVKSNQLVATETDAPETQRPWVKKLAPLVFLDMGRAKIVSPVAGEDHIQELLSIGTGLIVELGEHFNAAIYYGFPLRTTETTDSKEGRVNVAFMLRW